MFNLKKTILITVLTLSVINIYAEEETYLEANHLKGEVRYIEAYSADARMYFDEIKQENEVIRSKLIVNEYGRLIELLRFYKGKATTYEKYWYQDDLLFKKLHRDEDGINTIKYAYNENNELTKSEEINENEELLKYSEYKYENHDCEKIMWVYNYNINNEVLNATKYRHNINGEPIEEITYDCDGNKKYVSKCQYDENGEFLNQITYNSEGVISSSWSEEDNIQSLKFYDETGEVDSAYIYILNEEGLIKEYKTTYSEDTYYLEDSEHKYEYEYDEQGNWIKKTEYEAFEKYGEIVYEPIGVETRKIIYQENYSEIAIQPEEYSKIGIEITPEEEKSNFYVFEKVDPIDDVKTVFFMLDAYEGENQFGDAISLVIRAKPENADVYIRWETYLGTETTVTLRIDNKEAETNKWSISTNSESSFYPDDRIELIKELFNAEKLIVRTTPYGENPITASFDISDFYKEAEPYLEYLNWDF